MATGSRRNVEVILQLAALTTGIAVMIIPNGGPIQEDIKKMKKERNGLKNRIIDSENSILESYQNMLKASRLTLTLDV